MSPRCAAGLSPVAIDAFSHYYRLCERGETGLIHEESIRPLLHPPTLEAVDIPREAAERALAQTAIIKLNGGLGTSMGLHGGKTLLPVRDGKSLLDLIVDQVLYVRRTYGVRLPLIFMNSYRTQATSR